MRPRVIAFDGDDTLWHTMTIFTFTEAKFAELLRPYAPEADLAGRLIAAERRNLAVYGYGIKGYMLSMVETAIEVTDGRVPASDIRTLLEFGRAMLAHPVELLDGVRETLEALHGRYELWLITKGDLFDQEGKIARSGLTPLFTRVDILSEKDAASYRRVTAAGGVTPNEFLMVGNSMRSDILPVLDAGGSAVHIPYHITWVHEEAEPPAGARYQSAESIRVLPALLGE